MYRSVILVRTVVKKRNIVRTENGFFFANDLLQFADRVCFLTMPIILVFTIVFSLFAESTAISLFSSLMVPLLLIIYLSIFCICRKESARTHRRRRAYAISPRSMPYFLQISVNSCDCPKNCMMLYLVCVPFRISPAQ